MAAAVSNYLGAPAPGADRPQLDRFGGWTGRRFEASGFFRVHKDERWWLVTPDGNAFLSFGFNHLHPNFWQQPYNRSAWQRALTLPNLEGPDFTAALKTWVLKTCREYGFNTVGVHSSLEVMNRPQASLPYLLPITFVDIPHWKNDVTDKDFVDVFSDEFAQHCNRLVAPIAAPVRNDPFLLGYAMTDCPLFTEEDCRERPDTIGGAPRESRIGWPRRLRNLGPAAPGKQAYVKTIRELYRNDIADFNRTYGSSFASFEALASAERWRLHTDLSNGNETRDNIEFLKRVVARYYQTALAAIRRYDPNHLFVGDKLNANTDAMDTLLPVTSQFTDVVLYQMYGRYEVQKPGLDRWSSIAKRPIINGDAAFTMITEHMPRPYGPIADSLKQRAEWTEEFFRAAFARPEFVGWHYCGLIDAPNLIPSKQARQHSGLIDGYGVPYGPLKKVVMECTNQLYPLASKAR